MAIFKISKGNSVNLPVTYEEGHIYFTIDNGKLYIDTSNEQSGRVLVNAGTADKLNVADAGSSAQPVYFKNGVPESIGYTIETSVPKNAKFTDTTYEVATVNADGLMSAADKQKLDLIPSKHGVLKFGKYEFDGSADVTVDIFEGETKHD